MGKLSDINYGLLLKDIRKSKGLTQKELADICNISQTAIASIENGKIKIPGISIVRSLVVELKVNPYIFIFSDEKSMFLDRHISENQTLKKKVNKYEKLIKQMVETMNAE